MKYNVVLINDNEEELQTLLEYFSELHDINLKVVVTRAGFESYVRKNPIHLILANEKCLYIDPLSLCQHIRSLDELNFLPFLYLVKTEDMEVIRHAYELGVNECVHLPVHLEELSLRVLRYIHNYEALKKCLGQKERLAIVLATDQLTKVSNRMHLQTLLAQAIKEYQRYETTFSIVYFRIHDMQKINTVYGYKKGDKLLKDVAQFVAHTIRTSDVLARWGGGDFMILAPNTKLADVKILAKKLDKELKGQKFLPSFQVRFHFGITEVRKEDTIYSIVERAKKSLQNSVERYKMDITKL